MKMTTYQVVKDFSAKDVERDGSWTIFKDKFINVYFTNFDNVYFTYAGCTTLYVVQRERVKDCVQAISVLTTNDIKAPTTTKKSYQDEFNIQGVYFNELTGTTVVKFNDDSVSKTTCSNGDFFDPFVGFCIAFTKGMLLSKGFTLKAVKGSLARIFKRHGIKK